MIEILRPGALTTVQDLGRPGYAGLGVPRSGALDQPALRLANRLVGNPEGAAGLETTLTGCSFTCQVPVVVAVTGAPAKVTVGGRPAVFGAPFTVAAGGSVAVGTATRGLRTYLAISGGIAVEPVLGSRSTDTLSGLGPAPLRAGDRLPLGPAHKPSAPAGTVAAHGPSAPAGTVAAHRPSAPAGTVAAHGPSALAGPSVACGPTAPAGHFAVHGSPAPMGPDDAIPAGRVVLRVRFGPRDDWFTPAAREAFLGGDYTLSPMSNRVGTRLTGASLARARQGELPSEGIVLGAVQVPADGQPLIFLADHPTTGGYPVIAVVHPDDLALLAQARPGTTVSFRGPQR